MFLLLILISFLLLVVYKEFKYSGVRKQIAHTKGPPMLPFIGNAHQLGKSPTATVHFMFENFYKYGNFRAWIGYYLYLIISEPEDVEYVLASTDLIGKSDVYDMMHPWLGDGLLTSKGSKWHKHRKMITPSFHFKILQDFHEVMNTNSSKFIEKLREVSQGDNIFDFQGMVNYLTLDVICDTAMGVNINAMDNPHTEFAKAVEFICLNINMRAFNPLKRKHVTYQFFPDFKEYCRALKVLKEFTYDVIQKRMDLRKREEEEAAKRKISTDKFDGDFKKPKMAFLDTLLSSTVDGRPLTIQEVYEEVSTFMFEGHDTTTSALSFITYLLSRHLGVQRKVYEEQRAIMGEDMKRNATFQEINDMKYLDMVIKESLRLYPSVPIVGRLTDKEYNMNGKIIPPDTSTMVFIMALGYNEKTFPDPYRFDPERFSTAKYNDDKHNPFDYVPFSAGPRNCIGQKFAILEIKTAISKIVRHFEILPALDELESKDGYVSNYLGPNREKRPQLHKYEPRLAMVITLKSDNGIMLRMRERK
ncbi:cytochrome P450 4e2-like [Musca vetustissima]|uniref:cytochrome P450 4e2-like n=1 Tax=Musca vetustissima TaxID=27455 RepID=UPI002AB66412|nr:cytochrome P450 4e2-like [Musca vetustissima]